MTDGPWIDFDGDGEEDSYDTVELEDGGTAYVHYDEETGEVDAVAADFDGDGLMDEMVEDTDGDGTLDTGLVDNDGDGIMDEEYALDDPSSGAPGEDSDGLGMDGFLGENAAGDPSDSDRLIGDAMSGQDPFNAG